ncbi:cupin domain-containing protein [Asticcacaulis sp.]|uniref:JmjC domain-containing protein n=1 Tax=Asticcacaulis sp. TaxID=1872648 RepID=UPI0026343A76|nr:cupin domain-containing protein [Asticcacaulis sp.]
MMISFSEKIFSILSVSEWNERSSKRQLCHMPGVFPESADLISWGWLEDFLNREYTRPELFRFFMSGRPVEPGRFSLIDQKGQLDRTALRPLLTQGITAIFNSLDSSSDYFWQEAIKLEQALGAVVSLDAIGSFGTVCGLPPHYDDRDLIIVQVAGRKRWKILGTPIEGPWRKRTRPVPDSVTDEFVMQAGDMLFVPAGLYHQCVPLEPSLHLGALVTRPCGADLLKMIQPQWETTDPGLGTRLYAYEGETDLGQQDACLKQALIRLVQEMDVTALTRAWLAQKQRPLRAGLLGTGGKPADRR